MGGGDLNMKKSWHPALLVNQDKVWQAEKKASEEKKALRQLQKERDEERQLAELQRLQEAQTGRKRVEKLDWMYAAPTGGDGMGGKYNERELEDYLLGKKRVDEALREGDKDVGNTSKDFIAVQNANTARDTASKIREDPMLAMKKAEQAQLAALMNRPDIRRQLKKQKEREGESKEERRERRRAEKEERRKDRHDHRHRYDDDGDRDRRHRDRDRSDRRDRDRDYDRERRRDRDDRDDRDRRRHASRSVSPRRDRDRDDRGSRRRDDSPRRDRNERSDRSPLRRRDDSSRRDRSERSDRSPVKRERDGSPKRPSPRDLHNGNDSRSNGDSYRNGGDYRNGRGNGYGRDDRNGNGYDRRPPPPRRPSPERKPAGNALDDMRAARLAAMSASADTMAAERQTKLAQRAAEEKRVFEAEERARSRYHKDEAAGMFMKHQEQLAGGGVGLAESLQRRGGQGLLRDI